MRRTLRTAAVAVTALLAIGLTATPGHAQDDDAGDQVGLLNLNNTDVLHNTITPTTPCLSIQGSVLDLDLSSPGLSAGSCE